jgi:molecular chaperone DnaK
VSTGETPVARIIGIDLGTTYSAVSIWDEKKKAPVIIPNLRGTPTTPSVVGLNDAGEVIVGEDAKQNSVVNPGNTVSEIKREMGTDFRAVMGGKEYNPQTISAFILRYLKLSAEKYLGEPVHDAVITVPAYFKEVQKSATRDAGIIAGFNVHRLINEPTAAAVAYGVTSGVVEGGEKTYAVYDLGGGTFDVSIIEIKPDDIAVVGTGGDSRLGGLDMDEEVMKWALRQINTKYHVDLSADHAVRRRLKVEAEDIKKTLVVSETATLNVPFLTVIDGKPLSPSLQITRGQFEMLIQKLLERSMEGFEAAVASAEKHNHVGWDDIDGVILVGGPTRLQKIHDRLRAKLKEHCPDKEPDVRCDLNPDEVVALGAALVAGKLKPIGRPPEEVEVMKPADVEKIKAGTQAAIGDTAVPVMYDVTGHSLGIAVEGTRFAPLIVKETVIPGDGVNVFTNAMDYTTELLAEVYQGEDEYVAANTKIGEVRVTPIEPLPKGHHQIKVMFHLDPSGTLSTECTDMRTGRVFSGTFKFDAFERMSEDDIKLRRAMVAGAMAEGTPTPAPEEAVPVPQAAAPVAPGQAAVPVGTLPQLLPEQIPADWRVYWKESIDWLSRLDPAKQQRLLAAMNQFAAAVGSGQNVEEKGYTLQDTLYEVRT